ncbi:MAG: hypothetical protein ACRBN8_36950 [Nannocystales bacterium]
MDPRAELWSFDPGDGSGFCLAVARRDGEFSSDLQTISVVQELPTCAPTNAYTIVVQN